MKKKKDVFTIFKEIWKTPRYKGLVQICFWLIFFTFVILFIRTRQNMSVENTITTPIKKEDVNQEVIDSYIYNYQILDNENTINISGTYYKGIDLFNYNNNRYYIKNNLYYTLDNINVSFDYDLREYQYNNIINLIKDREYDSKTEYKDKTIEYHYVIDNITYNNYYNIDYQTGNNILVNVKYNGDLINSVTIDLSNYYLDKINFQVHISYTNINNVDGFDINIE